MLRKNKNKEKIEIEKKIKSGGNGHLVKVVDTDGSPLPSATPDAALDLIRNYSAKIQNDNSIQLSEELFDGSGFSVKRGWRDDHVSTTQPWAYSPSNLDRDFLLSFDTLREVYRRSPHVRPAVDSIIKEIAQLPVKVDGPGKEEVEEFINRPNISKESWSSVIQKLLNDLLVLDQAVIEKVRSISGKIVEIYARDGSQFRPVPDHSRSYITYFKQLITDNAGKVLNTIDHDVDDIVWFVQFPRSYSFYGTPIIETVVNEVSTLLYSSKSIARHFVDDEIPPGILYLERIGRKAYERAKSQFEANRGEEGKKRINVIDNVSKAEWIPFTRPFREMQLAEITLLIQEIVFRNFGISSIDIGDAQGLTRQTADRLWKTGRSKLFRPLVTLLTNKLNKELISEIAEDTEIKFVLEPAVDVESAKEMSDAGIITKNEARKALGFDEIEGGNKLAVRVGNQYIVLEDNMTTGTSQHQETDPKETVQDVTDSFAEQYKGLDEQYAQWAREYENDIIERQSFGSVKFEKEFNSLFEGYLKEINSEWGKTQTELLRRFETEIRNPLKIKLVNGQPKIIGGSQPLLDEKILVGIEEKMMPISNKYMRKATSLGRRHSTSNFGKSMVTGAESSKIAQQHLDELSRYWRETYSEDLFLQVDKVRRGTNVRNLASKKKEVKSLMDIFSNRRLRIITHGLTKGVASISLLAADRGKTNVKWMCNLDATTCDDCEDLAYGGIGGQGIYTIHSLPKMPGETSLLCCENCRCWLDFVKEGDTLSPSPLSGADIAVLALPELFSGTAMRAPAIGSRVATKAEIDVVKKLIQDRADPRIFELLDTKQPVGVSTFKSLQDSPTTTFVYQGSTKSIGVREDVMKSMMRGESFPAGPSHEFVHHIMLQSSMETKVIRLGKKLMDAFKKEGMPIPEHVMVSSRKFTEGIGKKDYDKAFNFVVGNETAAMILETKHSSRANLIKYLSRSFNFVTTQTGNDVKFLVVRPNNAQLDKLVDIVEESIWGTTNVLGQSKTVLPTAVIKKPSRTPSAFFTETEFPVTGAIELKTSSKMIKELPFIELVKVSDIDSKKVSTLTSELEKNLNDKLKKLFGKDTGASNLKVVDDFSHPELKNNSILGLFEIDTNTIVMSNSVFTGVKPSNLPKAVVGFFKEYGYKNFDELAKFVPNHEYIHSVMFKTKYRGKINKLSQILLQRAKDGKPGLAYSNKVGITVNTVDDVNWYLDINRVGKGNHDLGAHELVTAIYEIGKGSREDLVNHMLRKQFSTVKLKTTPVAISGEVLVLPEIKIRKAIANRKLVEELIDIVEEVLFNE